MINTKEVETKYSPVKTNSIDEFLRSVKRKKMKYQKMHQSNDNELEGETVLKDSHAKSSNHPKQISGTESSEPKSLKAAIQQDDNCIHFNEIAQNRKLFELTITQTPSPRIKKRIRREQFLQEHKDMGKLVLKMAKSTEMLRNQDEMSNPSETTAIDFNMMTHEQVNLILAGVLTFPPNH